MPALSFLATMGDLAYSTRTQRERLMNTMRIGLLLTTLALVVACESNQSPVSVSQSVPVDDPAMAAGEIIGLDPSFDQLLPAGVVVEKLVSGFQFIEGPVWLPGEPGRLLFSDIPANTVYQWSAKLGAEVFLSPVLADNAQTGGTGGSNGLALDPAGNLILCEHGNRRVARMDENGIRSTIADSYDGRRLNSPNDIVYHASGAAFFTDPPYGLAGFEKSPAIELDFFAVFRLTPQGQLFTIDESLEKPNGIALSTDQKTLFVSNSVADRPRIVAIDLDAEGDATGKRLLFDASSLLTDGPGSTDGMALHPSGFLFVSIPNGIGILSPQGELLGKLALGQITNMAFDDSFEYLYITAPQQLLRLKIKSVAR